MGTAERIASVALGVRLLRRGLRRRGILGWGIAVSGALLASHGLRRHSRLYEALGVTGEDASPVSSPLSRAVRGRSTITITAPPARVYWTWRELSGLPRFFPHVERVEELDGVTSRWTGTVLPGRTVEWVARIEEDVEGERIAWRSVGGEARHTGSISFEPAPQGRGTRVVLELRSQLPGGVFGATLAKLAAADPASETAEALRRLRQWIETGQFASAVGPAARDEGWARSSLRGELFLREPPWKPAPPAGPSGSPSATGAPNATAGQASPPPAGRPSPPPAGPTSPATAVPPASTAGGPSPTAAARPSPPATAPSTPPTTERSPGGPRRRRRGEDRYDPVEEASMDSFPASDPPAFNAGAAR